MQLLDTCNLLRISYYLGSAGIAVVTDTSGALNITGIDGNLDGGFFYVNGGTGAGQIGFIISSVAATPVATMYSDLTTPLDSTSTLIKILPLFYKTPVFAVNTVYTPQTLDSTAAAGSGEGVVVRNVISINGADKIMDPLAHHNTQKLNKAASLEMYALMGMPNSIFHYNY